MSVFFVYKSIELTEEERIAFEIRICAINSIKYINVEKEKKSFFVV